jgi:hypothetical protein
MAVPVVETVATSGSSTNVSTCTVTMPSGVASGDLLVVSLSIAANRTITAPSGWTLVYNDLESSAPTRVATYYRVAGSSEPASYDWTVNIGTNFNASALRISGVNGTTPIDVSQNDTTASNSISPSVTTTGSDRLILRIFHMGRDRTFTQPTSHTKQTESAVGVACDQSTATITQSGAGATGTATWTVAGGGNDRSVHHVLAIAPPDGTSIRSPLIRGELTYPATLVGGRLICD